VTLVKLGRWDWSESVDWVPVKSKMLVGIAYNADWQQLYLKFHPGDVYCYRGVPPARYRELLAADSKGNYTRDNILHCYPYQRIYIAGGPEDQVQSADQRLG
jgi:hypothetical protein